jgi:hypothetical protein
MNTNNQPTPGLGIAPARIGDGTTSSDLVGRLVLLRPLTTEPREWTDADGATQTSTATVCQVVEVADNGGHLDHGQVPIFWSYVQEQLRDQTSDDAPWLLGTPEKGRRAFRVTPPTREQLDRAAQALAAYNSHDATDDGPF